MDRQESFVAPAGALESEVAFLGTGSAIPSKYRNVTGMLVRLSPSVVPGDDGGDDSAAAAAKTDSAMAVAVAMEEEQKSEGGLSPVRAASGGERGVGEVGTAGVEDRAIGGSGRGGSIIMDAGEGTMGQLWRMFGDSSRRHSAAAAAAANTAGAGASGGGGGAQQVLRDLSAVWISHPHADHHLGLVRILSERNKLLRGGGGGGVTGTRGLAGTGAGVGSGTVGASLPKLLLMAPAPVAAWLKVYYDINI